MTDTANAPEREAGTPGPHEPDYKTAMLYHSDRADAYMGERDALTAELAKLRADLAEAQAKIARLTEALAIAGPIALKVFDPASANGKLMIAVCATLTTPDTRDALIKELVAALDEIANIKERKKDCYPPDWRKQIAACPECQRYKGHPIQQGICDEHRKPIYAQEDHDRHETKILGYRSMDIARAALTRAKEAGYGAE